MKMSRRAKRMERNHRRASRQASINLVSMMDIFTILVFFLLVNSADIQVLPGDKSIKLPESVAEQKPKENLIIMVSGKDIVIKGRKLATVQAAMDDKEEIITALKTELDFQANKIVKSQDKTKAAGPFVGEVTIMGDKEIPYRLLKKIMLTCTKANFTNISLAVVLKEEAKS